jgi:hypothetical protein
MEGWSIFGIEPWKGGHSADNNVQPDGTTKAVLAFVHGFSDHCKLQVDNQIGEIFF